MTRAAITIGFGFLAAAAIAQSPGELAVQSAFQNLRTQGSIWLRQQGSETLGSTVTSNVADVFWYSSFDPNGVPILKLEAKAYVNSVFARRTVGDGTTLWDFDALANKYSAVNYGAINAKTQPPTYQQSLMQGFGTHAKGTLGHAVRLIREVYSGGFAQFKPWLVAPFEQIVGNGQSMSDPVSAVGRTYVGTPELTYVVFWVGSPATRSVVFEIYRNQANPIDTLQRVYYADLSTVGTQGRLVEWQMSVAPISPNTGNFIFVPPANATPIVRTGGGN